MKIELVWQGVQGHECAGFIITKAKSATGGLREGGMKWDERNLVSDKLEGSYQIPA